MTRFKQRSLPQRLALGAVAGVAATFVMQGMMTASGKLIRSGWALALAAWALAAWA